MSMFTAGDVYSALSPGMPERLDIRTAAVTGSTNDDIKVLAEKGAEEGTAVIAGAQTAGKGRLGRSFYSPGDSGLYMSVLLRPRLDTADALAITTSAAVSAAEAVESVTDKTAGIKWVNDIYVSGRKVCGILTESSLAADGSLRYAVLGIGINAGETEFPPELRDKAGTLGCGASVRPVLAAKVLERFFAYYDALPSRAYMEEYRRRSVLTGKTIEYEAGGILHTAEVLGIDDEARLKVRTSDGKVDYLASGEVNIKTNISSV